MRLKQKIMMVRQAALARAAASLEVSRKTGSTSTKDESIIESPLVLTQGDLEVNIKVEELRRTVKMEERLIMKKESSEESPLVLPQRDLEVNPKVEESRRAIKIEERLNVKKESSESDWTPEEYEDRRKGRRNVDDKILVKEYGTVSTKKNFKTHPMKNIAINYGKAMATFAASHLAIPYIQAFIKDSNIDFQGFILFVKAHKNKVKSMMGIRSMVLVEENDDAVIIRYKKVFQKISEVFLKQFSVNWIIHSKLDHKLIYLKWRFKMLRRVQYPDIYTTLHGCNSA